MIFLYLYRESETKEMDHNQNEEGLDFIIDKLTNSIENVRTGDSFQTEVSVLLQNELNLVSQENKWLFDWGLEFQQPEREIFKLTIIGNPKVIQGVVSLEVKEDHVFMHLLESAPFNKGKEKVYSGVPGNLVAYACKLSFQRGHDGYIAFISKSSLIDHYKKSLGAKQIGSSLMVVEKDAALHLIGRYFKN